MSASGDVIALRAELNNILSQLNQHLAQLRGDSGTVVHINGDIDMHGGRIKNLGHSREPNDAPSRAEMQEAGMYSTGNGHIAKEKVVMNNGARITSHGTATGAMAADEVITRGDLRILVKQSALNA